MKLTPWILAILVVYAPLVAPMFMGPLTECDHCVQSYAHHAPLVPAFWLDHSLMSLGAHDAIPRLGSVGGTIYRGLVCLAMVGAVRWLFTRRRAIALPGSALAATLAWLSAMGFSILLRM